MPLPLWIPLLALAGALASDQAEDPRGTRGEPLNRSPFDVLDEVPEITKLVAPLAAYLDRHPVPSYYTAAVWLHQQGIGDPNTPDFAKLATLLYGLARARAHRTIWKLDEEAYQALVNTNPPWELVRDELPRMPFPAMLIRLPEDQAIRIQITQETPVPGAIPAFVDVKSILLIEDVPGQKWRYLGFNDAKEISQFANTKGYLDLGFAGAKAQLTEGVSPDAGYTYSQSGDDRVWVLALNLLLALNNHHLDGQRVVPQRPKSGRKSAKLERRKSFAEYTVVRLSQASRQERDASEPKTATATGRAPQRRHLRPGHWHSFWVLDPGDKPIYAVKPRVGTDERPLEGHLYKVVKWIFPHWAGEGDGSPPGRFLVKP